MSDTSSTALERFVGALPLVIVGVIADVSAVVLVVSSRSFRDFVGRNPWVWFWISIVTFLVWIACMNVLSRRLMSVRKAICFANEEAVELRAEIAKLQRRPSDRDVEQFRSILNYFPMDGGIIWFLNNSFNARIWIRTDTDPLYEFTGVWQHKYFDDEIVDDSFTKLRKAVLDLTTWMSYNASVDREYPTAVPDEWHYSVPDGNRREGGWKVFDAVREEGLRLADEVRKERIQFERIGRERGL